MKNSTSLASILMEMGRTKLFYAALFTVAIYGAGYGTAELISECLSIWISQSTAVLLMLIPGIAVLAYGIWGQNQKAWQTLNICSGLGIVVFGLSTIIPFSIYVIGIIVAAAFGVELRQGLRKL